KIHEQWEEDFGVVAHTSDGGRGWELSFIPSGRTDWEGPVWALSFVDANEGWAAGESSIRHTTNGGKTWEVQYKKEDDFNDSFAFESIQFLDRNTGWATGSMDGDRGYFTAILRTNDGGKTWKETHAEHPLVSVRFLSTSVGVGVGAAIPHDYVLDPRRPA